MVTRGGSVIGPVLYGFAWTVVAPAILLWWALATAEVVPLPALHSPVIGGILAGAGVILMALGMGALAVYGRGLPMNAYPPPLYVVRGIYGWVSHPIYVGFVLLAFGLAIAYGSASGLWLVSPSAALALVALVMGYEAHDLRRRFGDALCRPRLALPTGGDGRPGPWERASVYVLVLLPWLLFQLALPQVGVPADASAYSDFYLWITLGLVLETPLMVRRRWALRRFAISGLVALGATALVYLAAPAAPVALPVLWALLVSAAWWSIGRYWGVTATAWVVLLAAGALAADTASPGGLLLTVALFAAVRHYDAIWHGLRHGSERLANSWKAWRIGPVRIINHGLYAGLGGAVGLWIAGRLAGPNYVMPLVLVGVASLLGALLWAQFVEGSPVLLRPLGWYGGLIGGLMGIGALWLLKVEVLPLLGALAVATPWIQAAGRLRCLVQGCCHGACAGPDVGIRYYHARSRVTQIAGLKGVPLHPTPLYSILSNIVMGVLLYRLWVSGTSIGLVIGIYLILSGVTRFVEESYRGEPQTPIAGGLRLYQWLALGSFAVGILFTTLNAPPPSPAPTSPGLWAGALLMGVIGWLITGVDFPGSNRRFSRLASVD